MMKKANLLFISWIFLTYFSIGNAATISVENKNFFDESRHRNIPVLIYTNTEFQGSRKKHTVTQPVAIINHGYTIKNSEYTFLANKLAANGYLVISIQHDLKTDIPLIKTGNLYQRRKPMWDRGVQNILFVMNKIKQTKKDADFKGLTLIGHSNGGDISMLFAAKYPELVHNVISLDSLRMPFPANKHLRILSLRANDTIADEGVLPNRFIQEKYGIKIISLKNANHIDLCDRGSNEVKQTVNKIIVNFLNKK